jgi:hypothetical protein
MSFLAPLYALGFLAIALPVYFHLIRRRPKGQMAFSSLMFLSPTPPPPTHRRRLDQLLLLLLRITVLILLAFAFMRPFFREDALADTKRPGQRIAILIDTSASMKRGDLWSKAIEKANSTISDCRPTDRIGLFAFDRKVKSLLGFGESAQLEPQQQKSLARDRLEHLTPSWGTTDLGHALVEMVQTILESGTEGGRITGKIVLISDLPQGVLLTELTTFEWPQDIELELKTVTVEEGNAGIDVLANRPDLAPNEQEPIRVRIVNDARSNREQFSLSWDGIKGTPVDTYIPPGESRVVKMPKAPANISSPKLKLHGDVYEFDNTFYLATPPREEVTVLFLGSDEANDPNGLRYFLKRTWSESPERIVHIQAIRPDQTISWESIRNSPLVVITKETSNDNIQLLGKYLRSGGTVLYVSTSSGGGSTLAQLSGTTPWTIEEAPVKRYAMLQDIHFEHPLFTPFSGTQFSDFTKIHFWKHRKITSERLKEAKILARFDDGDPAVLEQLLEKGRLFVFTSSWQPADSQFARSTKFVPFLTALLELRSGRRSTVLSYRIGDRIPIASQDTASSGITIRKPDGSSVSLPVGTTTFDETEQPGVYIQETVNGLKPFAVNLDPMESLTTPLPVENLEQFGCRLSSRNTEHNQEQLDRQMRDTELERNQSIWRGLILLGIIFLFVETALAGWRAKSSSRGT